MKTCKFAGDCAFAEKVPDFWKRSESQGMIHKE